MAAQEAKSAFPFSRAIWLMARATDDVQTSTITSTFSVRTRRSGCRSWRSVGDPGRGLSRGEAQHRDKRDETLNAHSGRPLDRWAAAPRLAASP